MKTENPIEDEAIVSRAPGADSQPGVLLLDRDVVRALLDPNETLAAVRRAFEHHAADEGKVFPMVREPIQGGAVFGIKSGEIPSRALLGVKVAGFWPENRSRGKGTHQASLLMVDPATGRPEGFIDGNDITAMRTGAAGGLGIQILAPDDCTNLCVFGTGVQARIQVDFALSLRPTIRLLRYVTSHESPDAAFEDEFCQRLEVRHEVDADLAVAHSELVITATPSRHALFSDAAVQPGTHINAVGADTRGKRELPEGLLHRSRLVVDDEAQARQVGEAQWAPETEMTELGAILLGRVNFLRRPADITLFDMTGLALQDLVVARLLLDKARDQGVGRQISWAW